MKKFRRPRKEKKRLKKLIPSSVYEVAKKCSVSMSELLALVNEIELINKQYYHHLDNQKIKMLEASEKLSNTMIRL